MLNSRGSYLLSFWTKILLLLITIYAAKYQSFRTRCSFRSSKYQHFTSLKLSTQNAVSNDFDVDKHASISSEITINKGTMNPYFRSFYRDLISFDDNINSWDAYAMASKHLQSVLRLIKCDQTLDRRSHAANNTSRVPSTPISIWDDVVGNESNLLESSDNPPNSREVPHEYIHTILFLNQILSSLRHMNSPKSDTIYKILQLVMKEDGLRSILRTFFANDEVTDESTIQFNTPDPQLTSRDVIEIKRKIERMYSSTLTIMIAYRSCLIDGTADDFVYFCKVIVDSTPGLDKHFAILMLCRGIFSPPYLDKSSKSRDGGANSRFDIFGDAVLGELGRSNLRKSSDMQSVIGLPFPPLKGSYNSARESIGLRQNSKSCRIIYPYLSSMCRLFYFASGSDTTNKAVIAGPAAALYSATSIDASSSGKDGTEKYLLSDLSISRFFAKCGEIDRRAKESNALTNQADEMISSMYRWLCDMFGLHFIREIDENILDQSEVVKRNSVAMELLSTNDAFVMGRQRALDVYLLFAVQMGKALHSILALVDSDQRKSAGIACSSANGEVSLEGDTFDGSFYGDQSGEDRDETLSTTDSSSNVLHYGYDVDFLTQVKKIMAVISFAKRSSRRHPLAVKVHRTFGLHINSLDSSSKTANEIKQRLVTAKRRFQRLKVNTRERLGILDADDDDDSLFSSTARKGYGVYSQFDSSRRGRDDDLWGLSGKSSATRRLKTQSSGGNFNDNQLLMSPLPPSRLVFGVNSLLIAILTSIMSMKAVASDRSSSVVATSTSSGDNGFDNIYNDETLESTIEGIEKSATKSFSGEIDYIFSTWRRPHLLLDYYLMHHATPSLQSAYANYLRALFGLTTDTVDSIRLKSHGNLKHLRFMHPELLAIWTNECAAASEDGPTRPLPGYSDPQTLFMIGEDCSTCMSIRAKQKATNRGLLSFLLHGNCRVLGVKDDSGKLTVRAMAKLLVDEATKVPVLYVESPFGSASTEKLLEIFDQAAELGDILEVPVIYASAPQPLDSYCMGAMETQALLRTPSGTSSDSLPLTNNDSESFSVTELVDYSAEAPFIWIDGIKNPQTGNYLQNRLPKLVKVRRDRSRSLALYPGATTAGSDDASVRVAKPTPTQLARRDRRDILTNGDASRASRSSESSSGSVDSVDASSSSGQKQKKWTSSIPSAANAVGMSREGGTLKGSKIGISVGCRPVGFIEALEEAEMHFWPPVGDGNNDDDDDDDEDVGYDGSSDISEDIDTDNKGDTEESLFDEDNTINGDDSKKISRNGIRDGLQKQQLSPMNSDKLERWRNSLKKSNKAVIDDDDDLEW